MQRSIENARITTSPVTSVSFSLAESVMVNSQGHRDRQNALCILGWDNVFWVCVSPTVQCLLGVFFSCRQTVLQILSQALDGTGCHHFWVYCVPQMQQCLLWSKHTVTLSGWDCTELLSSHCWDEHCWDKPSFCSHNYDNTWLIIIIVYW